jgi:hypothetical protein
LALVVFLFLLPSSLFYGYLSFLVKYAVIIGVTLAIVLFTCKVLLIIATPVRRIVNVTVYAATPMVLLETVIGPIKGSWLVPLFDVFGITFYALSLGIYFGLVVSGLLAIERSGEHPAEGAWSF